MKTIHLEHPVTKCVHKAVSLRDDTRMPPHYIISCGSMRRFSDVTFGWKPTAKPVTCKLCIKLERKKHATTKRPRNRQVQERRLDGI